MEKRLVIIFGESPEKEVLALAEKLAAAAKKDGIKVVEIKLKDHLENGEFRKHFSTLVESESSMDNPHVVFVGEDAGRLKQYAPWDHVDLDLYHKHSMVMVGSYKSEREIFLADNIAIGGILRCISELHAGKSHAEPQVLEGVLSGMS